MRIAICDDNINTVNEVRTLVNDYFSKYKIATTICTYTSGEALLKDSEVETIDIVFLDIEMPGISGINVGKSLKSINKHVIIFIITSYSEYLDEAMKFQIFRYLSKPIDKQRLFRNLNDAISVINSNTYKITIETREGNFVVPTDEIIMVEASERRILIHTTSDCYETNKTMDYWEQLLTPGCFFRTHKSFIVNMEYISDFDHSVINFKKYELNAYLTKRKYTEFKSNYFMYLEGQK